MEEETKSVEVIREPVVSVLRTLRTTVIAGLDEPEASGEESRQLTVPVKPLCELAGG